MQSFTFDPSHFGFGGQSKVFSAMDPNNLGATSYTLITILVDCSSSVAGFANLLSKAVESAIQGAARSPQAANMMVRMVTFADRVKETFGFKELMDVTSGDYAGAIAPYGCTALNDAIVDACSATLAYGKSLTEKGFLVNAVLFVLTDGEENASRENMQGAQTALSSAKAAKLNPEIRVLESLQSVLVGVNVDPSTSTSSYLDNYKGSVGIDNYIAAGDASPATMAKIGHFVASQSISQSKALGTGSASKLLSI